MEYKSDQMHPGEIHLSFSGKNARAPSLSPLFYQLNNTQVLFREQQNMFRLTMASDVRLVVAVGVGLDQEHEVNNKLSRNSNKNPCCSYRAVPIAHAAFRRRSSSRGVRVFVQFGVLVAHNVWIACVASAPTRCKLA